MAFTSDSNTVIMSEARRSRFMLTCHIMSVVRKFSAERLLRSADLCYSRFQNWCLRPIRVSGSSLKLG